MDFLWTGRSRRGKALVIGGAVLLAFILIGVLAPSEEAADNTAAQEPPAATTATPAEDTEPPPPPAEDEPTPPPPEDVDTGRMSEGEYEQFSSQVADVDAEMAEYGEGLGKCGVLIQAVELAEASQCVDEADNGVGDAMLTAYSTAEGLEGDVGKACLKNLKAYKSRLDVFYGWYERTTKAGKDLQFEQFNTLAQLTGVMTRRYTRAKEAALASCNPA
jgi:hypothetical protein